MIYICYIIYKHYVITSVLTIGDDELVWETMMTHCWKLLRLWACVGVPRNSCGWHWETRKPGSGLLALPRDHGNKNMT